MSIKIRHGMEEEFTLCVSFVTSFVDQPLTFNAGATADRMVLLVTP